MEDVFDFPAILREARSLFATRTRGPVTDKERKNYCTNKGVPKYTFGIQSNKIVCAWVGNFRKDRKGRPKKDGTCTIFSVADIIASFRYDSEQLSEGFTSREWDRIGLDLIHLHEQLK